MRDATLGVRELMARFSWEQMSGQQGRFVLADASDPPSLGALTGDGVPSRRVPSISGGDEIHLVPFDDGGLISYLRENGQWLHTLNTPRAFKRRVWDLGLDPLTLEPR
jgi:hypothetical protein